MQDKIYDKPDTSSTTINSKVSRSNGTILQAALTSLVKLLQLY